MKRSVVVAASMPIEMAEALRGSAEASERSFSAELRRAIRLYLGSEEGVDGQDDLAFWKAMARKHERRHKEARRLIERLVQEVRVPSRDEGERLREISDSLEALYAEKRKLQRGVGDPFERARPADGTQEIIGVPSTRKRRGEVPAVPPREARG